MTTNQSQVLNHTLLFAHAVPTQDPVNSMTQHKTEVVVREMTAWHDNRFSVADTLVPPGDCTVLTLSVIPLGQC